MWQRKAKLINKYKPKYKLFDQLTFPHLYCMLEISRMLEDPLVLKRLYVMSLVYRKNYSKLHFPSSKIDYRLNPEYYVYIYSTLGYNVIEPYCKEISTAISDSNLSDTQTVNKLYEMFIDYLDKADYIGADMVRKNVQVLNKSNKIYDKFDLIRNNVDYVKWILTQNYMLTDPYVPTKKIFE